MSFKKGNTPWNVGLNTSIETRKKQSISAKKRPSNRKGIKLSEETKIKLRRYAIKNNVKPTPFFKKGIKLNKEEKKDKRLFHKGDRPWNFKGITSQNRLDRARFRKTIQKEVFKRDNYICQLCGSRGIALQVDHIQSWSDYIELRFNIQNCRTVCRPCHYQITYNKPMPKNSKWGRGFAQTLKKIDV